MRGMQRTRGSVAVIAAALPPLQSQLLPVFQYHHSDSSVVITQRRRLVAQSGRCAGNHRLRHPPINRPAGFLAPQKCPVIPSPPRHVTGRRRSPDSRKSHQQGRPPTRRTHSNRSRAIRLYNRTIFSGKGRSMGSRRAPAQTHGNLPRLATPQRHRAARQSG
jgi:hypothetical protein